MNYNEHIAAYIRMLINKHNLANCTNIAESIQMARYLSYKAGYYIVYTIERLKK